MKVTILQALPSRDGYILHENWQTPISYINVQDVLNGFPELVRCWDGLHEYTMLVNDSGLRDGLPRNQLATELYLANVRTQFPGHPKPWVAAKEEYQKRIKKLTGEQSDTFDISPADYEDDPYIAGNAIVFLFSVKEFDDLEFAK